MLPEVFSFGVNKSKYEKLASYVVEYLSKTSTCSALETEIVQGYCPPLAVMIASKN
jgi:hypothetical protein